MSIRALFCHVGHHLYTIGGVVELRYPIAVDHFHILLLRHIPNWGIIADSQLAHIAFLIGDRVVIILGLTVQHLGLAACSAIF